MKNFFSISFLISFLCSSSNYLWAQQIDQNINVQNITAINISSKKQNLTYHQAVRWNNKYEEPQISSSSQQWLLDFNRSSPSSSIIDVEFYTVNMTCPEMTHTPPPDANVPFFRCIPIQWEVSKTSCSYKFNFSSQKSLENTQILFSFQKNQYEPEIVSVKILTSAEGFKLNSSKKAWFFNCNQTYNFN